MNVNVNLTEFKKEYILEEIKILKRLWMNPEIRKPFGIIKISDFRTYILESTIYENNLKDYLNFRRKNKALFSLLPEYHTIVYINTLLKNDVNILTCTPNEMTIIKLFLENLHKLFEVELSCCLI